MRRWLVGLALVLGLLLTANAIWQLFLRTEFEARVDALRSMGEPVIYRLTPEGVEITSAHGEPELGWRLSR